MSEQDAYKKSSFGPAFFFLGRQKRNALAHYYNFCRLADDTVDEPNPNAQQTLKDLAAEVEYIYLGAPKTQWGEDLVEDVRTFSIDKTDSCYYWKGCKRTWIKENIQHLNLYNGIYTA